MRTVGGNRHKGALVRRQGDDHRPAFSATPFLYFLDRETGQRVSIRVLEQKVIYRRNQYADCGIAAG